MDEASAPLKIGSLGGAGGGAKGGRWRTLVLFTVGFTVMVILGSAFGVLSSYALRWLGY
jgi:hypothetical protein